MVCCVSVCDKGSESIAVLSGVCVFVLSQTQEDMASTGDLEPTHFPARRAAQVALHHLNTIHGSPFSVFGLQQVHKASAEVRLIHSVCRDFIHCTCEVCLLMAANPCVDRMWLREAGSTTWTSP